MLGTLLLLGTIEFGEVKACSDTSINVLDDYYTIAEPVSPKHEIFENGSVRVNAPMPPYCSLVNSIYTIQFDVSKTGEIENYKVLSSNPERIHARSIKKAIIKGKVVSSAYGTKNNRVLVKYVQFSNKT